MTRNTRLFKTVVKLGDEDKDIIYKELTVLEIKFLENIKNHDMKEEMAGRISIINMNPSELPWPILIQIGQNAIEKTLEFYNPDTKDVLFEEIKANADGDKTLYLITRIKSVFPSESILALLNLTFRDLLELVAIAELVTGKNLMSEQTETKGRKLINPQDLPDGGKSLQDKLEQLNQNFGY